ncbi:uncharacterized protein EI90DRAFT_2073791 [Cantharellus anzutake]|uniref:uncharacterized protein n=1 Tax=Cantharellus anzutake TaxID=1750568 RepID=UPI001903E86A|nr:uncharacterized protein EI90DRAFT_2073791 [Cantharellus anzutake]KAF8340514.1 hypothetical protein EI90DRAFT_2073791 [Cantharellus anzutake]
MDRVWTPDALETFNRQRDEYLADEKGKGPWSSLSAAEQEEIINELKGTLKGPAFEKLKAEAWALEKPPVRKFIAPVAGKLLLPRNLNSTSGHDIVRFNRGDDLSAITYRHYNTPIEISAVNYVQQVASDGSGAILPKRHEYLGPSPHVASYRITKNVCEIEFWEPYLEQAWFGRTYWTVEEEYDEEVRWWFPVERSL